MYKEIKDIMDYFKNQSEVIHMGIEEIKKSNNSINITSIKIYLLKNILKIFKMI